MVRSRAHADILGSHSSMAQLSETIYHRESNTHRAAKSTIDPFKSQRQTHSCLLYCRLHVCDRRGKVTRSDLAFHCGAFNIFSPWGYAKGAPREGIGVPRIQKNESLKRNSVVHGSHRSYLLQRHLKCQACFEAP